ncbi:sigma-E factor negative regulatory protein [Rubrivivax albus]|uniref:Anti-sigma 24 factor n=1 Tax=Rubrivivax albus TaxID=2499835 RepID=A0A3S2UMX7_9BURK|nr:sigma-E factor negative regulatory protein [Rubrivivax albus]RVT49438.1 anti-sigma 24 factor [Rubrivivax albus]
MNRPHATPAPDEHRQWLSDLADGRLDDHDLAGACRRWAEDDDARRTWHAYHLIGDVLRSDDLARPAAADAAFLQALRQRLADEPVVLAPAPLAARPARQRGRRQLWLVPMAAAAGFVAVAGVMVVLQQAAPGGNGFDAPQMAATPPLAVRATLASTAVPGTAPATVQHGQMLRDARVDEYLRAHREVLMGSPAALPGGAVRTVDFDAAPAR